MDCNKPAIRIPINQSGFHGIHASLVGFVAGVGPLEATLVFKKHGGETSF